MPDSFRIGLPSSRHSQYVARFSDVAFHSNRPHQPRRLHRRQLAGRRFVDDERRMRMFLQETRRHLVGDFSFDRFPNDRRLVFPQRHDEDLLGRQIVPTPIVTACVGTFSSPKNPLAASRRRVCGSSVTIRVRLLRELPGSLKAMCPWRPIPNNCSWIPPAFSINRSYSSQKRVDIFGGDIPPRNVDVFLGNVDVVEEVRSASSGCSCGCCPDASESIRRG